MPVSLDARTRSVNGSRGSFNEACRSVYDLPKVKERAEDMPQPARAIA